MPANPKRHALARQWELLKLLPTRGAGKTARELAEALNQAGFRVSKRQVERDLGDLMENFAIDCNNASIPFGWRWVAGASADLPGITLAEALSLHLIEESVQSLLPTSMLHALRPRFQQAVAKLEKLSAINDAARWKAKVRTITPSLPLLAPTIKEEVLESVHAALLSEHQLKMTYKGVYDEEPHELIVHPLGLVQRGPASYLVATAFQYTDVRLYAMHRIATAESTDEPISPPAGFDLDDYIARGSLHFGDGKTLKLKTKVDDTLGRILAETPLSTDQVISTKDGALVVTATVAETWQLEWWLLAQGDLLEVLAPKSLRKRIGEISGRMAALYTSHSR